MLDRDNIVSENLGFFHKTFQGIGFLCMQGAISKLSNRTIMREIRHSSEIEDSGAAESVQALLLCSSLKVTLKLYQQ